MTSPWQMPFGEAEQYLRNKIRLPSAGWTDLWQEQHAKAFVVAGAMQDDLLEDLYNAVRDAQANGTGLNDFKQRFGEIADRHGWAYKGGRDFRARAIYHTNLTQAYNAARYQQMQTVKEYRPYWMYVHSGKRHYRLRHKQWDGMVLPADDPFWQTHYPQNGFGCGCSVRSYTKSELDARGLTISKSPQIEYETVVVGKRSAYPRTVRVPKGIDPGFAYNPGQASLEPFVPEMMPKQYAGVFKQRGLGQLSSDTLQLPRFKRIDSSHIDNTRSPADKMQLALDTLGVSKDGKAAIMIDAAGRRIAVGSGLFTRADGSNKAVQDGRLDYLWTLMDTLHNPQEIWTHWEQDTRGNKRWRLKRRYLKAYEIVDQGKHDYGVGVFEWSPTLGLWDGLTVFNTLSGRKTPAQSERYFQRMRVGQNVYKDKAGDEQPNHTSLLGSA